MDIIGHKKILNLLEKSIEKNSVSHAYLFSGPEKVGKNTVALWFAGRITENRGEYNSDLMTLSPELEEKKGITKKKDIPIEAVRELGRWLSLSSYGKRKVAIIDEADRLSVTAQNALLKTLEETAFGNVVILVSQNENKLLPTVLSRCQRIKFGLVSAWEMRLWIKENKGQNLENEMLVWSLGRPGMLLDFLEDKSLLETRMKTIKEFRSLIGGSLYERFCWAERDSKDVPLLAEKLCLWIVVLREYVLGKEQSASLSQGKALQGILEIEKSLHVLRETNSQARLVLENLLLTF